MSLSEQQLVDCETEDHGCDGGNTYNAFTYLIDHWAYLDSDWPYVAEDTKCTYFISATYPNLRRPKHSCVWRQ